MKKGITVVVLALIMITILLAGVTGYFLYKSYIKKGKGSTEQYINVKIDVAYSLLYPYKNWIPLDVALKESSISCGSTNISIKVIATTEVDKYLDSTLYRYREPIRSTIKKRIKDYLVHKYPYLILPLKVEIREYGTNYYFVNIKMRGYCTYNSCIVTTPFPCTAQGQASNQPVNKSSTRPYYIKPNVTVLKKLLEMLSK